MRIEYGEFKRDDYVEFENYGQGVGVYLYKFVVFAYVVYVVAEGVAFVSFLGFVGGLGGLAVVQVAGKWGGGWVGGVMD